MDFQTTKREIEILFFGDLVGRSGRQAVYHYLDRLPSTQKPDVVIANVENATHGFGLSQSHYHDLLRHGLDILTGGNHIFDRRETLEFMDTADRLLRPHNLPGNVPGTGAKVFHLPGGLRIGVLNLLGQSFMANYNSPWEALEEQVPALLNETPIVFLDFHAESTAEKNCLARIAAKMGVSAMVGTHTHVQTADERILLGRMGYVTDAGFNGARESVIGMDPFSSISRMRSPVPVRLEVSTEADVQVNAVRFHVETASGLCTQVSRINETFTLSSGALAVAAGVSADER